MSQAVSGSVVIVTGASSGIGAATAREFARQGAHVVLAARRTDALNVLAYEITHNGGHAIAIPTDVTDTAQVMHLVERTRETYGQIDVLVNNAGVNWEKQFVETPIDDIVHLLQANLLGMMILTRTVLPVMQQQQHGAIISVGSVASHVALEPLYAATKFGVRGFSLALRRQLEGSGIAVSLVTPGNIRTSMTRALQERMPEPESIARIIVRLAISPRREVIVPFKYHGIIWLDRLLPGVADFAYHWRHRDERKQQETHNLPVYTKSTVLEISE